MVVGKQGKTIKNIKLRSGASVWLAPDPLAYDYTRKALTLTGSKEQVRPTSYTLHPTPCTLKPKPSTLIPQPSTLNSTSSTLNSNS